MEKENERLIKVVDEESEDYSSFLVRWYPYRDFPFYCYLLCFCPNFSGTRKEVTIDMTITKAIAEKYGDEAVQNPRANWTLEKKKKNTSNN